MQSAPLRATLDKGETVGSGDIAAFLQKNPGVADVRIKNGVIYVDFGETVPGHLLHSNVIFWTMGKDKNGDGLWYCYLDEPHVLDEGLFAEVCKPQ